MHTYSGCDSRTEHHDGRWRTVSAIEPRFDRSHAWYATEVPSIVAGLQASRTISSSTANQAWELIERGSYDRALAIVLGEAV